MSEKELLVREFDHGGLACQARIASYDDGIGTSAILEIRYELPDNNITNSNLLFYKDNFSSVEEATVLVDLICKDKRIASRILHTKAGYLAYNECEAPYEMAPIFPHLRNFDSRYGGMLWDYVPGYNRKLILSAQRPLERRGEYGDWDCQLVFVANAENREGIVLLEGSSDRGIGAFWEQAKKYCLENTLKLIELTQK